MAEILEELAVSQLRDFSSSMLLSPEEYGAVIEHISDIGCYMDPILQRNHGEYCSCAKKSGKLRVIIDCRRANAIFKIPPKGHVVSSAAFGELEQHISRAILMIGSRRSRFLIAWELKNP